MHMEPCGSSPAFGALCSRADIGVRGIGTTKAEAFEQAAIALTAVLTDPLRVLPESEVVIEIEAADSEALLVEWLNAPPPGARRSA